MPQSLVLINPGASRIRASGPERIIPHLTDVLAYRDGVAPEVVAVSGPAAVPALIQAALERGMAAIVGVGGDGTQRGIAECLAGTNVPLGIIPGGTGNILGGALGVPGSIPDAIAALATARARPIDLADVVLEPEPGSESRRESEGTDGAGEVGPVRTISAIGCGIGFDARLMATTEAHHKARFGRLAYFGQALRLAATMGAVPYRITVDDQILELDASVAMVTNLGDMVPGLIRPRLPVLPDDGLLDLFVVGARGPVQGLAGLADHLLRTTTTADSRRRTIRLRCRTVRLESTPPEPMQVDGDPFGVGSMSVSVRPAALHVLVPPSTRI